MMGGPLAALWAEPMQQRLLSPELIHVAAAGEARGRVVLAVFHTAPAMAAIDAALTLAQAFDANLEALLIECPDAVALAAHTFAREISHGGRTNRLRSGPVLASQRVQKGIATAMISDKAVHAKVGHTVTVVAAAYADAVRDACDTQGPWNIVVRAEAMGPRDGPALRECLHETPGATGLVVVGAQKPRNGGDVIVVVEDVDRLTQMVRAAQRIAAAVGASGSWAPSIRILLAGPREEVDALDGLVRLAVPTRRLAGGTDVVIDPYRLTFGTHAELSEAIRTVEGCFVVCRYGGVVLPSDGEPNQLAQSLRGPLLLVR